MPQNTYFVTKRFANVWVSFFSFCRIRSGLLDVQKLLQQDVKIGLGTGIVYPYIT